MAKFQTHINCGIALGVALGATAFWLGMFGDRYVLILLAEFAVIVGSIAPDIDSDTSVPFHLTLSALALLAALVAGEYAARTMPGDYWRLGGYAVLGAVMVWLIGGAIFKKLTHHRGMVHSIPAALLSGLILYAVLGVLNFKGWEPFLISLGMTLGYLLHLILDEYYAATNFHGHPFVPNKALGSALKFTSGSYLVNVATYATIIFLVYLQHGEFALLIHEFAGFVRT